MENKKPSFDIVAIGDIVTDAFIELKDAEVHCDINHEQCMLSMRFGDKIPYKDVVIAPAVGNSPNAAVAAARLGLKTALVTDVGDDEHGKEDIARLKKENVDTSFVSTHKEMKSNYHYVLRFNAERTILIKHEEYPYAFPDVGSPSWIYLSSVGENLVPYHTEIVKYLTAHPETRLAFQPGTFQMKNTEALLPVYQLTDILFCNKEESQHITKNNSADIKVLLEAVRAMGPKLVVITDGPKGAYAGNGKETWFMPMYPDPAPPVERTGAGDAFSATFTVARALGKTIPEALSWGPINSMSVVQHVGAQVGLLTREQLEKHLANAPADYKPQQI